MWHWHEELTEQRSLNEYVTLGCRLGTLRVGAILLENLRRGLKYERKVCGIKNKRIINLHA